MTALKLWLEKELKALLGFDETEAIVDYVLAMEDESDLREMLSG